MTTKLRILFFIQLVFFTGFQVCPATAAPNKTENKILAAHKIKNIIINPNATPNYKKVTIEIAPGTPVALNCRPTREHYLDDSDPMFPVFYSAVLAAYSGNKGLYLRPNIDCEIVWLNIVR